MPAPEEHGDEQLIERAREGDLDAFNALVDRHQAALYTLCVRMLGDRHAAEDATQEAFLSAYRALARYEGGNVRGWLFRIAANECRDELRRRRRKDRATSLDTPQGEDEGPLDVPDSSPGAEAVVVRRELGEALEGLLLTLSVDQRQAIVLVDIYGFSYEEVAGMTSASIGTVKSRIHRGRDRLRHMVLARPELFPQVGRQEKQEQR